jgi:hypothetical protein
MTTRHGFGAKVAAIIVLIALADTLAFDGWGAIPGVFAIAWSIVLLVTVKPFRHHAGLAASVAAVSFAVILLEDPSLLAWTMFWTSLSLAALLTRQRFDDAWRWTQRLVLHIVCCIVTPFRDIRRLLGVRRPAGRLDVRAIAKTLVIPVIGSVLFFALFAGANPLIGSALARLELPSFAELMLHGLLWVFIIFVVWPSLRPHPRSTRLPLLRPAPRITDLPVGTLILSLIAFNLVFALQNGLDLTFLWSGADLPKGVSMVEYVHRGAYTLVATAILAGLFVVIALRPDSAGAQSPVVRRLLIVWVAQNFILVASSVLRVLDYIETSMLTVLRISALAWMGLVATGLALICWRLLANRSSAWLINANALAATIVLATASVVDLGAVAADWNVRHARTGKHLDLCYLRELGPSALLPLIALERRATGAAFKDRVVFIREEAYTELDLTQADPRTASMRGARRLAAADRLLGPNPLKPRLGQGRSCDGTILPPPPEPGPPPAQTTAPLTSATEQ